LTRIARWLRYRLVIPIFRSRHAPEYTARGVANGVFWGLTPSVGVQTIAIVATWFILRTVLRRDSSLVQAFIWVWVNNPITMIPLYYGFYVTGLWLTGDAGEAAGYKLFADLLSADTGASWWVRVTGIVTALGIPLMIGCVPYALSGTALSYRWALSLVRRRRQRLDARISLESELRPRAPLG
jgi:uncharacterized protein (DUF2062 family)